MEKIIYKERKDTKCEKWDGIKKKFGNSELLPLWVADMDFEVATCIQKSLENYISHGIFGYFFDQSPCIEAFLEWQKLNHKISYQKSWIRYSPGVVASINWLVQILSKKNEKIMVQTPVYYPFFSAIHNNKRILITCDLLNDNGKYTIDFDVFEKTIVNNQVKIFIFCSPHNPVGRVWTQIEIKEICRICTKYKVKIIADEIHQDIIMPGHEQIPILNIVEEQTKVVVLTSGTKTFNLASLQNSFVIIRDEKIREKFDQFVKNIDNIEGNAMGYIAYEAAYKNGRMWLSEVLKYIFANYEYLKKELDIHLPLIQISPLEGTYLVWLDFSAYNVEKNLHKIIQDQCRLAVDYGEWFGGEKYNDFIRINLATSLDNIKKAVKAICSSFN